MQTRAYHHDNRRVLHSVAMFDPQTTVNLVGSTKGVATTVERIKDKVQRLQDHYMGEDIMEAVIGKFRKAAGPQAQFHRRGMKPDQKKRLDILDKLLKIDPEKVIHSFTGQALNTAQELEAAVMNIMTPQQTGTLIRVLHDKHNFTRTLNFRSSGTYAQVTDIFDTLITLIDLVIITCEGCDRFCIFPDDIEALLCNDVAYALMEEVKQVSECLGKYTEAQFEEGLEWLQCLYDCE